mmetsp:Transcript_24772/g.46583  ORF Transcript_24772/g.46583 Transcript_24772/m.46583 type:complete len:269 (-) Transcript_24772:477-1283(-)
MGTVNVASMLEETADCMPEYFTKPEGSSTAGTPGKDFFFLGDSPRADFTSASVTRPNWPVPDIVERSIFDFLAKARAMGVAATTPFAGFQLDTGGVSDFFLGGEPAVKPSTSETVMRPSGPVPVTWDRSMFLSFATFFARGLAMTRPPEGAGEGADGALAAAAGLLAAGEAGEGEGAETEAPGIQPSHFATSSSFSTMTATTSPTSQLAPSSTHILAKNPSSPKCSTSISALSLSTVKRGSPVPTGPDSETSQETTFPDVMVEERAGM